eukprot:gene24983-26974_t
MPDVIRPVKEYVAYIDEAGDEGFGKLASERPGGQSWWLAIGACIVDRETDRKLPAWRDRILTRFPQRKTRDLHFRNLKHEQKVVACQEISSFPLHASVAMVHKAMIGGTEREPHFKQKGSLYMYLIWCLLDRLTAFCRRHAGHQNARLKVVFSRRANTDYEAMRSYLAAVRHFQGTGEIPEWLVAWDVFDIEDIAVEHHEKWAGLQIADVITSAVFVGFEPNHYGNYEHTYAKILRPKLMTGASGSCLDSGLTIVPRWDQCGADALQTALM